MILALIEWVDSASYNGWHSLCKDDTFASCISIGVLCHEDSEKMVIFQSKSDNGRVAETISIPKGCIKRFRKLKVDTRWYKFPPK